MARDAAARAAQEEQDRSGRWAWFVLGGTLVVVALVVTQLVAAWRDDSAARALLADLSPLERAVLADRVVDAEEMDQALRAWVTCQESAGFRVEPGGETYGRSDFSRELGNGAAQQAAEDAGTECDRENDAIEAVWFVQHDVGRGELGAARERLVECVSGVLGTEVDLGLALSWYADAVTGPDPWDDRTAVRTCSAEVTAATSSGFAPRGLEPLLEEADLG
ncbi:hypothetical protein N866_10050 [Actinotalea ferrariae CF5-4]|uniref:Uncharacterized protein n=1 Tax=Actinotalea ferrariae CF5-4 TaxID=948458 RepID=A0A021VYT0_9CELL|nr:hypothetical protein [Actinotalea ferrariae]EYR65175.1 hypothetical protein N866_10050 [Actinotalea ferrariae CF5-4]